MKTKSNHKSQHKSLWQRVKHFWKERTGLAIIIAAALLVELTTGVMYYSAQKIIHRTVERLEQSEMNAIYHSISNKLAPVEVTLDNMAWVLTDDLVEPDSLLMATRELVEHMPYILGCGVPCVPNLYPQRGYWYEPYSVRRADGTIESMQLGSADHDYTKQEFYQAPIAKGSGYWCEHYMDVDGAKTMVTTYCVPVRDRNGKIAAVIGADISLDWLNDVINKGKQYKSTQRFLVSGNYHLLSGEDGKLYQSALEHLKADRDKVGYVTTENENGEDLHVFFHPVGGKTDWVLINILNDDEVFGHLRQVRLLLLLMVLAGLVLIGFIVWRTFRNLERLLRVNAEKERIGGELRVASRIQQSMLPKEEVRSERSKVKGQRSKVKGGGDGTEVRGFLRPAREVGGDLYDYFVRNEKLFFCIGDVSGKGAPAAMLMAVTHALFRSASAHESDPAHIMQSINETICQDNESNMFVTLLIGVLDLPTGRLRYCDAGHDAPLVAPLSSPHGGKLFSLPVTPHLPVGVFEDVIYQKQEIQLLPQGGGREGAVIFLYTDGLTEAMNGDREQFGVQRIEQVLASCSDKEPKEILETMTEAVRGFVGDAEQSDDLTMLIIRYEPKPFESMLTDELTIKNDVKEVTRLSTFVKTVAERLNMEKSLARQLRLAVEEAVVNVIDYAYPAGKEGDITIKVMADGQTLQCQITDAGVPFDPTAKEKADTTLAAEDRQIGGLGILLVREIMDSVNYERINKRNILTLTKKYT